MLYNKDSWIGKYFGLVFENPLKTLIHGSSRRGAVVNESD